METCNISLIIPKKSISQLTATEKDNISRLLITDYPDDLQYLISLFATLSLCYNANIIIDPQHQQGGDSMPSKPCKDHLGNEYPSQKAMAQAYGINPNTFRHRLEKGMPLEEALMLSNTVTDHLGNSYRSFLQMAKAYGIDPNTLSYRLKKGMSLKEALTLSVAFTDHLGNNYPSRKAMAQAYGINPSTLRSRLENGKSLEEALTSNK